MILIYRAVWRDHVIAPWRSTNYQHGGRPQSTAREKSISFAMEKKSYYYLYRTLRLVSLSWRLGSLNGLTAGFLGVIILCRSGVRATFGVNMVNTEESEFSRLI